MKKIKRTKYLGVIATVPKNLQGWRSSSRGGLVQTGATLRATPVGTKDFVMNEMGLLKRKEPMPMTQREWLIEMGKPVAFCPGLKKSTGTVYDNPMEAFIAARKWLEDRDYPSGRVVDIVVASMEFMSAEDFEVEKVLDTLNDSNDTWVEAAKQER